MRRMRAATRQCFATTSTHIARWPSSRVPAVGKTTSCRRVADRCLYLDWDDQDDRRIIVRGPRAVVAETGIEKLTLESPCSCSTSSTSTAAGAPS